MNRCLYCSGDLHEIALFCQYCGELQEPALHQLINQTIGDRYSIYRRLNEGEHSTLFAATDLQNDKSVIIKISNPAKLIWQHLSHYLDSEQLRRYWVEVIERMRIETEELIKIRHPNIVRFYDTGMINDYVRYTVMEHLRGNSLHEVITQKGRIPLVDGLGIVSDLLSALREIHAHKIVHRELNTRNIILSLPNNTNSLQFTIKLTGFGIGKFSPLPSMSSFARQSFSTGAIAHDPPEQFENHSVDHRSDIYSIGAVFYEMLTGEPPFKVSKTDGSTFKNIWVDAKPIPPSQLAPDIPPHIDRAILRAMAKNPNDRQQSIDELADQLRTEIEPIFFPVYVDPKSPTISNDDTPEVGRKIALNRGRHRARGIARAIAAGSIALICGGLLSIEKPSSIISIPDKQTVISTALPSPSPIPTVTPIELKETPVPTNDTDTSKTTTQPPITQKTPEEPIAKPGVPTETLPSTKNEISKQPVQAERKAEKEPQATRPRMLQWSGMVRGERVVKIDLAGLPVKIDIPRATGCTVEIIEAPTAANNWSYVTLRVVGQGDASFQLRWVPISGSSARR